MPKVQSNAKILNKDERFDALMQCINLYSGKFLYDDSMTHGRKQDLLFSIKLYSEIALNMFLK